MVAKGPSVAAHKALSKMDEEMGKEEENFALSEETATELLRLLDDGQISFRFSY